MNKLALNRYSNINTGDFLPHTTNDWWSDRTIGKNPFPENEWENVERGMNELVVEVIIEWYGHLFIPSTMSATLHEVKTANELFAWLSDLI